MCARGIRYAVEGGIFSPCDYSEMSLFVGHACRKIHAVVSEIYHVHAKKKNLKKTPPFNFILVA